VTSEERSTTNLDRQREACRAAWHHLNDVGVLGDCGPEGAT